MNTIAIGAERLSRAGQALVTSPVKRSSGMRKLPGTGSVTQGVSGPTGVERLGMESCRESGVEKAVFALVGGCALVSILQAFVGLPNFVPNWTAFAEWVNLITR